MAAAEGVRTALPALLRQVSAGVEVLIVGEVKSVGRFILPPLTGMAVLGHGKGKLIR